MMIAYIVCYLIVFDTNTAGWALCMEEFKHGMFDIRGQLILKFVDSWLSDWWQDEV